MSSSKLSSLAPALALLLSIGGCYTHQRRPSPPSPGPARAHRGGAPRAYAEPAGESVASVPPAAVSAGSDGVVTLRNPAPTSSAPTSSAPTSPAPTRPAPRDPYRGYEALQTPRPSARLLTAASVGDADRFDTYLDYLRRRASERSLFGLRMERRIRFRVVDRHARPVNDAVIRLRAGQQVTTGRTHADGRWDFFPEVSAPQLRPAHVTVQVGQQIVRARLTAQPAHEQVIRLPERAPGPARRLDLAFLIDVTGSMGDELRYVNHEVVDIVRRIKAAVAQTSVRVGATLYRDRTDSEPLRVLPFAGSARRFAGALSQVQASGGGDYPEDMNAGLQAAMRQMSWSGGNAVRVLVVIADAPPQFYQAQYGYREALADAAARGIRILPVAASGANRAVEYLMRAMAVFTSTPYVYLTDDSGIGNAHMEADTDRVAVERFNDLLTRLIISDLRGHGMHEPGSFGPH